MARTSQSLKILECTIVWRLFSTKKLLRERFRLILCYIPVLLIVQQKMEMEMEPQDHM